MDKRYGKVQWGPHGERKRTSEGNWKLPLRWAKAARSQHGLYPDAYRRPRVFCASLADVFDNQVPPDWRSDLFALIEDTPELDWLLLTKRPENIAKMLWPKWDAGLPRNIWLGTTCEDQSHYNRRWPILANIPAAIRFISYEPALGPLVDLWAGTVQIPDWIICGGESENEYQERRNELRRVAKAEIDALERVARVQIESSSVQAQTEIIANGLNSEAAIAFLNRLPAIESMMPALDVTAIQQKLADKARKSGGYGGPRLIETDDD